MNTEELERVMRTALSSVAPDLEIDELDAGMLIRDQADFVVIGTGPSGATAT